MGEKLGKGLACAFASTAVVNLKNLYTPRQSEIIHFIGNGKKAWPLQAGPAGMGRVGLDGIMYLDSLGALDFGSFHFQAISVRRANFA
jgi:hypothetical protein